MKIPDIASGKVVPLGVQKQLLREAKEKAEKKSQRRHDYLVAVFSSICGGIMGFITSFIFWWITK